MKGSLLLTGAGVGRMAIGGETSFVTDTNGVLVVVTGVCPYQVLMPRLIHLTITRDVIVITSEPETGIVTGNKVLDGEPTVAARRAAMNDNQINTSHNFNIIHLSQAPLAGS